MRTLPLILIAAAAVCGHALAGDPADWFPLSEGCAWLMDARLVAPNGSVTTAVAHRVVDGQVERNGKKYYRVRTWMETGGPQKDVTKLTREDETGVYSIEEGDKDATEQREVVFPLRLGQSWKRTSRSGALVDTVIGVETVTVGDTTYDNCLHIRSMTADKKFSENYWEAPGVGNVKSVMAFANGAKIILTLRESKSSR